MENEKQIETEVKAKEIDSDNQNDQPYFDNETGKWKNYRAKKGVTPPWKPFDNPKKKRITIKERKFLFMLSKTGNLKAAYKSAYTVKDYGDPKLEHARINALAHQVLARLKDKAPELVAAFTFEDITPDFVKKELMGLYKNSESTIHEKTRILELMGKTQAMFTDKVQTETKIKEVIEQVYRESDDDFPEIDERLDRLEIEKLGKA